MTNEEAVSEIQNHIAQLWDEVNNALAELRRIASATLVRDLAVRASPCAVLVHMNNSTAPIDCIVGPISQAEADFLADELLRDDCVEAADWIELSKKEPPNVLLSAIR